MPNAEITKYKGLGKGGRRELKCQKGFTEEWGPYLNDTFRIRGFWVLPSARRGLNGRPANEVYSSTEVLVRVRSNEHPEYEGVLAASNFL
jgi:hypothetical protein